MTVEQLEAARAERMRQNGHGAITLEDVRTWIEETGLCIFLPRSAQAGFTSPTFVEAVAGQRTTEPTLELIATAETLLVRLEADGVAVRLNLSGLPGDQPDYVVAGWVLPYVYALRGDRDWRRSPQLTGSRQVSPLAVQAAKQIDSANMTAAQIRDALGREVTENAVLRALHELWKQLRIIPVVPEVGLSALWQPLRQRFQKAIAEGASTSQVTAISVLASIYLQAVIAASMEDVELFLSPLTSRSKIREVVRGLAATRQVHSTMMGHSSMYYVAGTLPEFPVAPSFQGSGFSGAYSSGDAYPSYLGSNRSSYRSRYPVQAPDEDLGEVVDISLDKAVINEAVEELLEATISSEAEAAPISQSPAPRVAGSGLRATARPAAVRPRATRSSGAPADRRRAPAARGTAVGGPRNSPAPRSGSGSRGSNAPVNGNGRTSGSSSSSRPESGRNGTFSNGGSANNGSRFVKSTSGARAGAPRNGDTAKSTRPWGGEAAGSGAGNGSARPTTREGLGSGANGTIRKPTGSSTSTSAAKRYSFSGQAKQAPQSANRPTSRTASPTKPRTPAGSASEQKRRG